MGSTVSNVINKSEMINAIAESANLSKADAGRALEALLSTVTQALRQGHSVSLPGIGVMGVSKRAARVGRNPKTGAAIQIAACLVPSFKASKVLKDAVNSGAIVEEGETA